MPIEIAVRFSPASTASSGSSAAWYPGCCSAKPTCPISEPETWTLFSIRRSWAMASTYDLSKPSRRMATNSGVTFDVFGWCAPWSQGTVGPTSTLSLISRCPGTRRSCGTYRRSSASSPSSVLTAPTLGLRFYQMVAIDGDMPDGGRSRVRVAVASIPALLAAMNGYAIDRRLKRKDAYDIYYSVRNFPGGVDALVRAGGRSSTCRRPARATP